MLHSRNFLIAITMLFVLAAAGQTTAQDKNSLKFSDLPCCELPSRQGSEVALERPALQKDDKPNSGGASGSPDLEAVFESSLPWISGVNWGGETFGGSVGTGVDFFGSNLSSGDYIPVVLEFSDTATTLCQTFRRDNSYNAAGVGTFPGKAWDMSDPGNPRRLNICFVEDNNYAAANLAWNPGTNQGNREYIFIMNSSYDGTGTTYAADNAYSGASSMDILYAWWPDLRSGYFLLESLPATLTFTPFYLKNVRAIPDAGQLTVTWRYIGTAADFKVYGGTVSPPTSLLATVSSTTDSYVHTGLGDGVPYYYRIEALDGGAAVIDVSKELRAVPGSVSNNMTLVGYLHEYGTYGDIWGYTDTLGNEYALICARNDGVSIVDINVTPPVEVGFMPMIGSGNDAKDVKVYEHYAYVIKEYEPVQIFDISDVTNPVEVGQIQPLGGSGAHNCMIDGDYLYIVGNHGSVGGLEIFDISTPTAPVTGQTFEPFYYHDVDVRNDTMAAAGIYGDGIDLIDLTNKSAPSLIRRFNYTGSGAHNAEFTADGKFVFTGDEIGSAGNHTRVFDISDLDNIYLATEIIVDPSAVVHNCYQKDGLLYIGHYTEGLRVWDICDPANPYEIAYYDSFGESGYGYRGVWSVYPYFASGKIIISDMQTGLYVMTVDNALPFDADADGVGDFCDNCPDVANPGQEDTNDDQIGDVCESCCTGATMGNVDCVGIIDIGDVTVMIQNLFIIIKDPCCFDEADLDFSGMIDIGDLTILISSMFITLNPLPACP